jgi:hypothetical protein
MKTRSIETENARPRRFVHKQSRESFELTAVVPVENLEFEHSHFLRNETHSWSGTEKQFLEAFERL